MRILIVNDFASINGGASRVALTSAIGLANAGHDVHFFAGAGPVDPKLLESEVKVTCLNHAVFQERPAMAALREGLWDKVARDRFLDTLAAYDPKDTIVHVHTNRDVLSASVPGLAIESGFSVVYTCHEYLMACPYGVFFDARLGVRCPERGGSLKCWLRPCNGTAYHKKLWSMTRSVVHQRHGIPGRVRHFVFISDFSQTIIEPYLPPEAKRYRVDNPIDVHRLPPKPVEPEQPFLMVGGLTSHKNPQTAARAAKLSGHDLVLCGSGPEQDALRSMERVLLRGWTGEEGLIRTYREARALIFVPLWPETLGLVVYEAAAQGLPCIVADDVAVSSFIRDNEAGLLVRAESSDSIAEAMSNLADPVLAARLGANAYDAFWSNPPTLDRHVHQLVGVYEQVLGDRLG